MTDIWPILEQVLSGDLSSLADVSPLAIFFTILLATFLTEEGACIGAGVLVANGTIGFPIALAACLAGIFVGDLGLYWIGRIFGRSITNTRIFGRFISREQLARAAKWVNEKGSVAIVISRFISGLRLPTYLAAGFLEMNFKRFTFYFAVTTFIWTPILIGSSAYAFQMIPPQYIVLGLVSAFLIFQIIYIIVNKRKRRIFFERYNYLKLRITEFFGENPT